MKTKYNICNREIELVQGSITKYPADVLVCPANGDLEMVAFQGNVQNAFLVEGGEKIFKEASKVGAKYFLDNPEMKQLGMVPEFSAHLTTAGKLPAKYVIHSVAVGYDHKINTLYCNRDVLAKSTRNALNLAREHNLTSIGFPALGTGLYNVPLEDAVDSMSDEFSRHLKEDTSIKRIGLIIYSPSQYYIGKKVLENKFL